MRTKLGAPKAITRAAPPPARLFFSMLATKKSFADIGQQACEQQYQARRVKGLTTVGLLLADLFPVGNEELIVGTLSGDLFVFRLGYDDGLWRTHLPGAIGCYNSILVDDLDGVNGKELYVAGSWGLWRFVQVQP